MVKRARRSAKDKVTPQPKRIKLSHVTTSAENEAKPNNTMAEDVVEQEEYDIEKIRLRNLQENAAFLQDLGFKNLLSFSKQKSKPSQNGLKEKRERVILPPRKSLRLQRMNPDGALLPELPVTPIFNEEEENHGLPEGPLSMAEYLNSEFEEKETICKNFHNKLSKLKNTAKSPQSADLEKFLKSWDGMELTEDRVAKVVPQRIFSVAVHPDEKCVLAVAGDKWGRIGFWDVGSKAGQDGVFCYRPHSRPVSCLSFHPNNASRLYSCSYDGTLRCADFEKAVFDDVYSTKEEHVCLNSFAFASPDTILVSNMDGEVAQIDCRSNSNGAENVWQVSDRTVKCVSVHPMQNYYFVTASNSGAVKVFDMRNLAKNPKSLIHVQHWKSVDSAYFSPLTGKYVLTTALDDCIRILDTKKMDEKEKRQCIASASHNNHTGRWLSNFKAVWHPQREDVFIVGSLARPRRIEVFNESCKVVKTFEDNMENLASVCSLNAFHPTRNILVGGNSSGRLHVFMD